MDKRERGLPEGIKSVGSPDVCAQHVQRVIFAAILEEIGEERRMLLAQPGHGKRGQKASSRPSPGKGCRGPSVPQFVILGRLETGVSILAGEPSKSSEHFREDPWPPPWNGPLISVAFDRAVRSGAETAQVSAAPAHGSLLKASMWTSGHHHCQPDGRGFSSGRSSADPARCTGGSMLGRNEKPSQTKATPATEFL